MVVVKELTQQLIAVQSKPVHRIGKDCLTLSYF